MLEELARTGRKSEIHQGIASGPGGGGWSWDGSLLRDQHDPFDPSADYGDPAFFAAIGPLAFPIWANPLGGNWNTGSNWSGGTVPTVADDAIIGVAGVYTVTIKFGRVGELADARQPRRHGRVEQHADAWLDA